MDRTCEKISMRAKISRPPARENRPAVIERDLFREQLSLSDDLVHDSVNGCGLYGFRGRVLRICSVVGDVKLQALPVNPSMMRLRCAFIFDLRFERSEL